MNTLKADIEQAQKAAELEAIAKRPSIKGKREAAKLTPAELDAKLNERLANGWGA